jgi:hypothetical protein
MRCHAQIEQVHTKVIRGELWEKAPGAIPACTDCHVPTVRRESRLPSRTATASSATRRGLYSYEDNDTTLVTVNSAAGASAHKTIPCVKCHVDVDPRHRPCEPSGPVDCSLPRQDLRRIHGERHGQARGKGSRKRRTAPTAMVARLFRTSTNSPTHRAGSALCGTCHREGKASMAAADLRKIGAADSRRRPRPRAHRKGLLPSAVCIDCHSSHMVLKHTDERSTVSKNNLPATCATCHRGIYKDFIKSVHYAANEDAGNSTCATAIRPTPSGRSKDAFMQRSRTLRVVPRRAGGDLPRHHAWQGPSARH